ncbi:uncharacterized protein At4g04775 [Salvia miltiorrhiza]|uniref:uncharacterized protein At4g04775 n=1 Tax=Salvia miltiorrhiza TaxID=226208 RepID=UPI0025AD510E|nr:uncharacterized protein At4g04775 [Salvia miltiorrhiza]
MENSSASSQSSPKVRCKPGNTNNPQGELRCDHDLPVEHFTSKTELNPFQRFYCCRIRDIEDCGVWHWIDPELTSHYKGCFHNLQVQRNRARQLLDINGMRAQVESLTLEASALKEELALQIEAFRELKKQNAAMEVMMAKLHRKNKIFLLFLLLLGVWIYL